MDGFSKNTQHRRRDAISACFTVEWSLSLSFFLSCLPNPIDPLHFLFPYFALIYLLLLLLSNPLLYLMKNAFVLMANCPWSGNLGLRAAHTEKRKPQEFTDNTHTRIRVFQICERFIRICLWIKNKTEKKSHTQRELWNNSFVIILWTTI